MSLADFHFAEPRWLWLAAIAPLLLALLHRQAARKRGEQLARLASPHFVTELTASHNPGRRGMKEILLLVVLVFAGITLARPQWGRVESINAFIGEDVVFALDCSRSMLAADVTPNRLQRSKYSILDFVQRQSHGRVGLVAFAGSAFIQCPVTFDTAAFEESLLSADENTMPIAGTDIGRALNEAYHALDKGSRRKMIVLVTDGEDLEKSGVAVARKLATNGVVIFSIGVGTAAGKEIQYVNSAGQSDLQRDAKGEIVRSQLDEKTLREIAEVTGGSYFPLGTLGEGLAKVGPAIQKLNISGAQRVYAGGVDRFYVPLTIVLALVIAESLIGTRRKRITSME
jgi:Ca-activated chloride channel family protein